MKWQSEQVVPTTTVQNPDQVAGVPTKTVQQAVAEFLAHTERRAITGPDQPENASTATG